MPTDAWIAVLVVAYAVLSTIGAHLIIGGRPERAKMRLGWSFVIFGAGAGMVALSFVALVR